MPQWGIEPHERASFAGWRPSFWPRSADAPCNLALLQNLWFTVGADSISARAISRNHPTARRGQDPSLRTDVNIIQRPKLQSRKIPGESGTPPPTTDRKKATKIRNYEPPNRRVLAPGRGQSVRSWILKGNCAERRSRNARAVSLKPGLPRYRK